MRMHIPIFPESSALFIIWSESRLHGRYSVAASGEISVIRAAFDQAVKLLPDQPMTLQHGARILLRHDPNPRARA